MYITEAKTKSPKRYRITATRSPLFGGNKSVYIQEGTLEELIKAYSYTLEVGKSWEHEKGNKKINMNPKNIQSLCNNLYNAKTNASRNGYSGYYYDWEEITEEKKLEENMKAKLVKESLNESFKSTEVKDFILLMKNLISTNEKLPYRFSKIKWSEYEGEIKKLTPEEAKLYKKDTSKIILWVSDKRKTWKWKPPTYHKRSGYKQDNSLYAEKGIIGITVGSSIVESTQTLGDTIQLATNIYQKPTVSNYLGLTQMASEAYALNITDLEKYSAVGLKTQRRNDKFGATALMKPQDLLAQNKAHYQDILKKSRGQRKFKEIDEKTHDVLSQLENKITEYATTSISFNKQENKKMFFQKNDKALQVAQEMASIYNAIIDRLDDILRDLEYGYTNIDFSLKRLDDYIERANELLGNENN